jgi:hypothetical protein
METSNDVVIGIYIVHPDLWKARSPGSLPNQGTFDNSMKKAPTITMQTPI